jgi:hypothetical protein
MTESHAKAPDFDPAAHLASMERGLGLAIAPEWRAGVESHVAAIARAADLVMSFPLDDELESAAVFEAGR